MGEKVEQALIDECVGNAHGNLARVRELVDLHPGIVDARASWDESPIEAATQMGHRPIIDYLIEHGAPVDFFTACFLGRIDQVAAELKAAPEQARASGVHQLPTLYFAAIGGQAEIAALLLAAGAQVNERAESAAPIHGAVMGGQAEMIRWLLARGADPSLPDYEGRSAGQLALAMGRPDLAGLFD